MDNWTFEANFGGPVPFLKPTRYGFGKRWWEPETSSVEVKISPPYHDTTSSSSPWHHHLCFIIGQFLLYHIYPSKNLQKDCRSKLTYLELLYLWNMIKCWKVCSIGSVGKHLVKTHHYYSEVTSKHVTKEQGRHFNFFLGVPNFF